MRLNSLIKRPKLSTTILMTIIGSVALTIAAISIGLYMYLSSRTAQMALDSQYQNIRTAATVLEKSLDGVSVEWADGEVSGVTIATFPEFPDNIMIDEIGRATGETATIFAWDDETQDFWRKTTNIEKPDGSRAVGTQLGATGAVYPVVTRGELFLGQAVILGKDYYTAYLPITDVDGKITGILYVGVEKAKIDSVQSGSMYMLFLIAGSVFVVVGTVVFFVARALIKPLTRLVRVMGDVIEKPDETHVPYIEHSNELGDMARAVEVFRENTIKVRKMTEEEEAQAERNRAERARMMEELQSQFGVVVHAAIAGDFSQRVEADFPDAAINSLAGSVNDLVETVDRGLGETGTVLAALAETDLSRRVTGSYEGAFDKLKNDTNAVADKLVEIVGQIKQTSRGLKTATGEILSGANDLSERTTKQAATIEETSAAMEQLAHTVMANAKKAEEASDKSRAVSQTAEEGGEVMTQANGAMEQITHSSAKISNIIGMIDDIAFQTNLLALNASVEAARAGEAGKGFAVVAVEVRRLAQSAAEASSEVKALIEQSASEVANGSRLVASAAEKLSAMLEAVKENSTLMQGIAHDSREQASAIDEVNTAVRQMDEMTQHNAALVEETNAAIEQTESQASELDRIVDVFTLDATASTPRAPAPQPSQGLKSTAQKVAKAARTYLSKGNAAVKADQDWSEF